MSSVGGGSEVLERGRESFARRAWGDAYAQLRTADKQAPLGTADLDNLATAAYLTGHDVESMELRTRAYHELADSGQIEPAVRCAFWLAFLLLFRGEIARSNGWQARGRRLLDEGGFVDCHEHGYLFVVEGLRLHNEAGAEVAQIWNQVVSIGDNFHDPDLIALGRLGQSLGLLVRDEVATGKALLDEVMVAVTAGELSPIVAGIVYCAAVEACQETFDLPRAREWTIALTQWCESQPDLVPYRGQCLVHRAEIMQLHGAWPDAAEAADQACVMLSRPPPQPAAGAAYYQQAELHRLRGEFGRAEETYRRASQAGRQPQPGMARLRLAQGHVDAAEAAIRRALEETPDQPTRARLLATYVDIALVARDVDGARSASFELSDIAAGIDVEPLHAVAAYATGAVELAGSDPSTALVSLRRAWTIWHRLDAPYEAARARVLIGLVCRALGDEDGAEMELDAARQAFADLGAAPDLAHVESLTSRGAAVKARHGLTTRELQVIRLVAAGKTNRMIAAELFLSEKTVARHVSNILTKLGLSSRAAATAYAYERDLV